MDGRLACYVPQAEFIKDVRVVERKICDDKPALENVLNDMCRDHPWLSNLVRAHDLQLTFAHTRRDERGKDRVGMLPLRRVVFTDRRDVETNLVKIFCA